MKYEVLVYPNEATRAIAVMGLFADERRARAYIAEQTELYPELAGKLEILPQRGLRQLDEVLKLLRSAVNPPPTAMAAD
jgi:hypothetical protein